MKRLYNFFGDKNQYLSSPSLSHNAQEVNMKILTPTITLLERLYTHDLAGCI